MPWVIALKLKTLFNADQQQAMEPIKQDNTAAYDDENYQLDIRSLVEQGRIILILPGFMGKGAEVRSALVGSGIAPVVR